MSVKGTYYFSYKEVLNEINRMPVTRFAEMDRLAKLKAKNSRGPPICSDCEIGGELLRPGACCYSCNRVHCAFCEAVDSVREHEYRCKVSKAMRERDRTLWYL